MVTEIHGDLFEAIEKTSPDTTVVIVHCVNDIKVAGSGVIVPLFKRFPEAKTEYFKSNMQLKDVSYAYVGQNSEHTYLPKFLIANMCAQTGIKSHSTGPRNKVVEKPGQYAALVNCMEQVKHQMDYCRECDDDDKILLSYKEPKLQIMGPRFCSDRAGLDWKFVRELIQEIWYDYDTYIYYL